MSAMIPFPWRRVNAKFIIFVKTISVSKFIYNIILVEGFGSRTRAEPS